MFCCNLSKDLLSCFFYRISGGELFERIIDEDFELTEREVIKYMLQIIDGVNFIHKQGIVHLDLKPENIMCINKTGSKIKLIDFGLARRLGNLKLNLWFSLSSVRRVWNDSPADKQFICHHMADSSSHRKRRNSEGFVRDSRVCGSRGHQLRTHQLSHRHVEHRSHLLYTVSAELPATICAWFVLA